LQQPKIFDSRPTLAAARAIKRHDRSQDGRGDAGGMNMSDIVARILLFAAYASIIVGTMGWFGNSHMVMR
jgi:hypothetical protein